MLRLLFWIALIALAFWLWRRFQQPTSRAETAAEPETTPMVRCAHCGVHLPQTDAVEHAGRAYCSMLHRLAGPRAPHGSR